MGNCEAITNDIRELQELKRMREDLDAAIEAAADKVKAALGETETGTFGPYKVTYKEVPSTRIDTTALKKDLPDVAARYSKTTVSRPLRIT